MAKEILIPIALAILISFLLFPLVLWMERHGLKRVIAVVITILVVIAMVGGIGYMIFGQFVDFVDNLPSYRKNIVEKVHALRPSDENVLRRAEAAFEDISREVEESTTRTVTQSTRTTGAEKTTSTVTTVTAAPETYGLEPELEEPDDSIEAVEEMLSAEDQEAKDKEQRGLEVIAKLQTGQEPVADAIPVRVVEGPTNTWQTFQEIVGPVLTILANAGLVILFVVFFLLQREDLRDRVLRLAGHNKVRVTTEALEEAAYRVSRYLVMQLIVNVTYGIPVAIGLWLIGVPNALLWGAFATILRFIPYVGPWIAASMPVALSLAVFDNWTMPLLVIGLFIVLELISNNIMEPILYGHTTGISPVAIIVSVVFWTWLWGAVGLVLATPMTVCLVVLGRYVPQLAFLTVMLGDEPVLADDARIYNRLLSGATDEAVDIAEEYLEENDLAKLYDDVLLPALESAEVDRSDEMLTPKRYERFIGGMSELIEAVTDKFLAAEEKKVEKAGLAVDTGEPESESNRVAPAPLPVRKIACIPVNDATDEAAAQMARHLFEQKDCEILVLRPGQLVSEIVDALKEFGADAVLLSSVPPFAVTHTRYLAKRLTAEFPDVRVHAGLWRGDKTLQKADERLKLAGVSNIYTSINDAVLHV
jgi:predicted PurR-regulated permease PerM